ncbi:MAG: FAD-binding protein [Coriobacteriia bacterium]
MVAKGVDEEFQKSEDYLVPLDQPPFHAYTIGVETTGFMTLGGLKIDTSARVLSIDGSAIPGLYAAGRTANDLYGDYMGSGTSIGAGLTFGRIAGQMAAAETPWA